MRYLDILDIIREGNLWALSNMQEETREGKLQLSTIMIKNCPQNMQQQNENWHFWLYVNTVYLILWFLQINDDLLQTKKI